MDLFIGNLPHNANLGELIALFKGFAGKAKFRMEQKRLEDGRRILYAVAEFENDKLAKKMMERHAGQRYKGNELVIREFFHRSYTNERRAVNWREKPWRAGERRKNDRRLKQQLQQKDEFEQILAASRQKPEKESEGADPSRIKIEAYANVARKD